MHLQGILDGRKGILRVRALESVAGPLGGSSDVELQSDDRGCHTVTGLRGHWYRDLTLPRGYQHFNWYRAGRNGEGLACVYLDDPGSLYAELEQCVRCGNTSAACTEKELYLYTHHQVYLEKEALKHTRSSPNWEGGLVTYATCKHLLRCTSKDTWVGTWIAGLCPKDCAQNTLLFAGVVAAVFDSNYALSRFLHEQHPRACAAKLALYNPRGDLYTPAAVRMDGVAPGGLVHDHRMFLAPDAHVRSVEFYRSSPGSKSDRPDGKVPKWWRDMEYVARGRRPVVFVLSPCWLFSRPTLWVGVNPRRATLRLSLPGFYNSLRSTPGS